MPFFILQRKNGFGASGFDYRFISEEAEHFKDYGLITASPTETVDHGFIA